MKSAGIHLLYYNSFRLTQSCSYLDKSTGPILSFVARTLYTFPLVSKDKTKSVHCVVFMDALNVDLNIFYGHFYRWCYFSCYTVPVVHVLRDYFLKLMFSNFVLFKTYHSFFFLSDKVLIFIIKE